MQQFTPDDKQATYHMYEALAKQGLTVMFHVGGEPLPSPRDRSKPSMILNIARDFPELKIIAAHLGGLNMWEEVYELLAGMPNVYMESSLSYEFIEPVLAEKIIRKHGHDKIFFGTDYPFGDIKRSLAAARSVPFLTEQEKEDYTGPQCLEILFWISSRPTICPAAAARYADTGPLYPLLKNTARCCCQKEYAPMREIPHQPST